MDAQDGVRRNSPALLPAYGVTDQQLAAELRRAAGRRPVHRPVEELLARHWEPVCSYARLCTDGPHPAGMLTTAAFTRLFEYSARQSGPTAAWRPQALVAVRELAAEWDTDHRRALLHPALRSAPGSAGGAAARLLPPDTRRLVSRAFQRLSEPACCLLWHTEVEREELAVPAALLGMGAGEAAVRLDRAREQLRRACLDIHRETAPDEQCRRYAGLLDVSLRREAGVLDPDLRRHVDGCAHCRQAAEQLEGFDRRLPLLLAEGVLGWGAGAYPGPRDQPGHRPGDRPQRTVAVPAPPVPPVGGEPLIDPADVRPRSPAEDVTTPGTAAARAEARPVPPAPGPRAATGHRAGRRTPDTRHVALAAAAVGLLVLIALALWSGGATAGEGAPPSGEPRQGGTGGSGPPSVVGAAADLPPGAFEGRLRNEGSGLCMGLDREKAAVGAEAVLVPCDSSATQQWSYAAGGLLRSAAAPDLCLDSHLGYSVQLAACTGASGPGARNVRYDLTPQGVFVPRWDEDLALAPASAAQGESLVAKPRTKDGIQRWHADTAAAPGSRPGADRTAPGSRGAGD
ncbi:ricin-type beta-trefoil lectin domain protein [Streptomyces sp. NPDC096198]|uniref:RICIN domain-containing protein n=1 Tax=Streptomyces sp. NPDC096198 TaxID=3366080 RepID=UPI0038252D2D